MRLLRWKLRHSSDDPDTERQTQALVNLVIGLGAELASKEHCQDMNDVFDRLADLTQQRLKGLASGSPAEAENTAEIHRVLTERFPLAAISTPACRDCGLCDSMERKVRAWLSAG